MRGVAKSLFRRFLASQGKTIRDTYENDLHRSFTLELTAAIPTGGGSVECIVFSKDRTMQLHAFLSSYFDCISTPPPVTVFYRASNPAHTAAYDELIAEFADRPVAFVAEDSFRSQLISHVAASGAAKILVCVDDMICKERFDGALLRAIDSSKHLVSLTRGRDLVFSTVLQKPIEPPEFRARPDGLLEFSWNGREFNDWSFPLGLSGYMFGRIEFLAMLRSLDYRAPNSLEAAMQALKTFYVDRPGVCAEKVVFTCVHANMVQVEFHNPVTGAFSVEELSKLWHEGKAIDVRRFQGLEAKVAEQTVYTFTDRTRRGLNGHQPAPAE